MKKNTKAFSLFILLFTSLITGSLYLNTSAKTVVDETKLSFDNLKDGLPRNFRKSSTLVYLTKDENTDLTNLDKLNIAGGQQFSERNLPLILKEINTSNPITVVDLRQESHGFINGFPISWKNLDNNANEGLSREDVILKEKEQLKSIPLNSPITIYNSSNTTFVPTKVTTEEVLVSSNKLSCIRIPVTDLGLPTADMVDLFLETFKNYPEDSWIYFHCKEGIGRTSTFMIMYDMLKNHDKVSADNIIERQLILANFDNITIREFYTPERYKFLLNFYNYLNKNTDLKWSEWIKDSSDFISISYDKEALIEAS